MIWFRCRGYKFPQAYRGLTAFSSIGVANLFELVPAYTTGNISDVDHNVNNEAEGPFKCIYVD